MKRLAALLTLLLLGAAEAPDQQAPACSAATAQTPTIEQITANYKPWLGKCVTVTGIKAGMDLLSNREAMLERGAYYGDDIRHSLVIYPDGQRKIQSPRWVAITGTIGSCAEINAEVAQMQTNPENGMVWVVGYCHTSLATFIEPAAILPLDRPTPYRLTEAEVPPDKRVLVPPPANFPHLRGYETAALALFRALADGDFNAWLTLARPALADDLKQEEGNDMPDWLAKNLNEARDAFAKARSQFPFKGKSARGLTARSFAYASDLEDWKTDASSKPERMVRCWCKFGSCRGKWPVAGDTDNAAARPYVCITASNYQIEDQRMAIKASFDIWPYGFAEPVWPR